MLAGTERVEEVVESDVGKFPKAVCGVYELEIALGLRSWDGRLGATTTNSRKEEEEEKVESSNTTTIDKNIVSDTQLMNLGNRELSVWVSEAAETLNSRDWKGLEKRNEEEEEDFARVSMGRDGVASMYKREDE